MFCDHSSHSSSLSAHHQRCCRRAVRAIVHALEQNTISDAGCSEEDIIALHEVRLGQHLLRVHASVLHVLDFIRELRCELAEHGATECAYCTRCNHSFRSASDTHQRVHTG